MYFSEYFQNQVEMWSMVLVSISTLTLLLFVLLSIVRSKTLHIGGGNDWHLGNFCSNN